MDCDANPAWAASHRLTGRSPCPAIDRRRRINNMKTLSVKLCRRIVSWRSLARCRSIGEHARRRRASGSGPDEWGIAGASWRPARRGTNPRGCADRLPLHSPPTPPLGRSPWKRARSSIFQGLVPDSLASPPPFRVLVGEALRLSGTLQSVSPTSVRVGVSWQSRYCDAAAARRSGGRSAPRRGEALVRRLRDARKIQVDDRRKARRWSRNRT